MLHLVEPVNYVLQILEFLVTDDLRNIDIYTNLYAEQQTKNYVVCSIENLTGSLLNVGKQTIYIRCQ